MTNYANLKYTNCKRQNQNFNSKFSKTILFNHAFYEIICCNRKYSLNDEFDADQEFSNDFYTHLVPLKVKLYMK